MTFHTHGSTKKQQEMGVLFLNIGVMINYGERGPFETIHGKNGFLGGFNRLLELYMNEMDWNIQKRCEGE